MNKDGITALNKDNYNNVAINQIFSNTIKVERHTINEEKSKKVFEPYKHLFKITIGNTIDNYDSPYIDVINNYSINIPDGYEIFQLVPIKEGTLYDIWFTNNEQVLVKPKIIYNHDDHKHVTYDYTSFGEIVKNTDKSKEYSK